MPDDKPKLLDAKGNEVKPKEKPSPIEKMGWTGKSKDVVIRGSTSVTVDKED